MVGSVRRMPGQHARGGGDAGRVDPLQLVGVREDVAQLPREQVELVSIELEMGERRDGGDLFSGQAGGHGNGDANAKRCFGAKVRRC